MSEVAQAHRVRVSDIKSTSRARPHVKARRDAAYRLYEETKLSFTGVGRAICRDHTSVVHLVKCAYRDRGMVYEKRKFFYSPEQIETVLDLHGKGRNSGEIALACGKDRSAITHLIWRYKKRGLIHA